MSDIGEYIFIGKVVDVFPDTYTARVEIVNGPKSYFGKQPECKILAMKVSEEGASSIHFPMPLDLVYVSTQFSKQHPMIIGFVPSDQEQPRSSQFQHRLTPVENIGANDINMPFGSINSRGVGPGDIMPGDSVTIGEEGQAYGILTGGTFIAKASHLCQLFLTKARDSMTLVSRRFKIYSDFGEITSTSEGGRASLAIRGNTSVQQSNIKPSDYEINIKLGGNKFLDAELGKLTSVVVQKNGQIEIEPHAFVLNSTTTNQILSSQGFTIATEGAGAISAANGMGYTVTGSESRKNFGALTSSITGTYTQSVVKAVRLTHNATVEHNISGISLDSIVDPVGYAVNVGRGDVVFDIGDPASGGVPTVATAPFIGSFRVRLTAGEFTVGVILGNIDIGALVGTTTISSILGTTVSSVSISEVTGALVKLDAQLRSLNGNGASDSVVTALRLTQQILNKVVLIFNIHQHPPIPPLVGGPVLPPITQMTPMIPTDICELTTIT